MAIVGFSFKSSTSAPPSAKHAAYIAREGEYERRGGLTYLEHGNMPQFAQDDPCAFWRAADQYERANGRTYTELQLTLPRELQPADHAYLANELLQEVLGGRFAYTMAIHSPLAQDKLVQPHIHLMFSERVIDERTRELAPDEFFRRNGAKKDRTWNNKEAPKEIRAKWCGLMNMAFEQNGLDVRVDPRSYRDQGREDLHILREPKGVRGREDEIAELRSLRKELAPEDWHPGAGKELQEETQKAINELRQSADRQIAALNRELAAHLETPAPPVLNTQSVDVPTRVFEQLRTMFPDMKSEVPSTLEGWLYRKRLEQEKVLQHEPRSARQIFDGDTSSPTRNQLVKAKEDLDRAQQMLPAAKQAVKEHLKRRSIFQVVKTAFLGDKVLDRLDQAHIGLWQEADKARKAIQAAETRYEQLHPAYQAKAQDEALEWSQRRIVADRQRDIVLLAHTLLPHITEKLVQERDRGFGRYTPRARDHRQDLER